MDWKIAISRSSGRICLLGLLIVALFGISLSTGVMPIHAREVLTTLLGNGTPRQEFILYDLRLPRMIIALLIGAGLGVAGTILQGLSRNALADPGVLGINSGAGLAAVGSMFFLRDLPLLSSPLLLPLFAFFGAFLVASLIYIFAWKDGVDSERLLLVGLGFNALCGALLIVLQLKMDPRDFQQATIWLTGSIWGVQWPYVLALLPWILFLLPLAFGKARTMNVLQLSEAVPVSLGLEVEKQRRLLLMMAAALSGACVAVGGGISFIGLLAPHLARRLAGADHFSLLPVSALIGSIIVLAADLIGKNILAPADIPVGIIVSVIGAPYLIYMLLANKRIR